MLRKDSAAVIVAGALILGAGVTGILIGKGSSNSGGQTTGSEDRKASVAQSVQDLVKRTVRRNVTIPAGSKIKASLESTLASHESRGGDSFTLQVLEPVVVEGRVAIPAGATVHGVVLSAKESGKIKGRGEIRLDFRSVTDVNGDAHDIDTDGYFGKARPVTDRDAAMIAGGAGTGAIVGGIVGGGKGALIGGLIGGAAGTGTVLATKGPEVRLARGTTMIITLNSGLTMPAGSEVNS